MKYGKTLFFLFLFLPLLNIAGTYELVKLLDSTRKVKDDSIRIELNNQFYTDLLTLLKRPDFVPDSIRSLKIGQSKPIDNKFIFYNWNIQQNDGTNQYSGIIYLPLTRKIIALPHKYSIRKLSEDSIFTAGDWPGGLYYKVIAPKKKTDTYYLLFGWDRFERQTSRKTIEAISIINDSTAIFGKEIFKTKEGRRNRVVIEYASTASMTLQYSKQKLLLTGVRKSQSRINDSIIVIDRLVPLNEGLTGLRWAYVPAGNIYDGYIYFKGYWTFVEGINARNPKIPKEDRKKNGKPEMDLLPK